MPLVELRYLDVRWMASGTAKSVTVAPRSIPIEIELDGTMRAETEIFHDLYPVLGMRLDDSLAEHTPVFVTAGDDNVSMQPVTDTEGHTWWVEAGPWHERSKRHLCELHRTIGKFEIQVGDQRLILNNVAAGLGRVELEDFLRDFQNDLYWLLLGFGAGKAVLGGRPVPGGSKGEIGHDQRPHGADFLLADALERFSEAVERVLHRPSHDLHEVHGLQVLAKLRPNQMSFRQYVRNPSVNRLQGRQAEVTVDIAENRYIRHMVQVAAKLSEKLALATTRQVQALEERAASEIERCKEYRATQYRMVESSVFDRQLAEAQETLERIRGLSEWTSEQFPADARHIEISIGKQFGEGGNTFFCNKPDGKPTKDPSRGIKYWVIKLPDAFASAVTAARPLRPTYEIDAIMSVQAIGPEDQGRLLELHQVIAVEPRSEAIGRKLRKRARLAASDWLAPLSREERLELQQEARTAELRANTYSERAAAGNSAASVLDRSWKRLSRQNRDWGRMGVRSDPQMPFGMRFSQTPVYSSCLAAFRKVSELADRAGFGEDTLDAVDRIGILHASALYEHWCLIKILLVLIEEFRFVPQAGWQELLIRGVTGNRETISIELAHESFDLCAKLDIQPVLPNGRTPDFRLRFKRDAWFSRSLDRTSIFSRASAPSDWDGQSALVMDAKFRNSWKVGELGDVLLTLVEAKRYGGDRDRVFVLQPAGRTVEAPNSPLDWGKDCDYGQTANVDHMRGHVRFAPGAQAGRSTNNLKRLIALHLQAYFPAPGSTPTELADTDYSICVRCGTKHIAEKTQWLKTKSGYTYWAMRCPSCEMVSTRTHCYNCRSTLFKNGYQLTYHQTLADQITNVFCPSCGAFFEEEHSHQDQAV
ncbi:hypothetical protein SAMN04488042_102344 [Shimia aestuarii]|uniref:DUF2357 domain-containing protein n=2 Tax=Shimia aestuarii TaxID=254406 RepID=A0A1I4M1L1_9RHOB|nr:hypothetical protein SAMN04488042_102344 [Shimia aestuarii]